MPFIPHSQEDKKTMLASIGVQNIEELFDEIPATLKEMDINILPEQISEQELVRLMTQRQPSSNELCFIGAGAYSHYIPAAVWELTRRGEFYTAYTPYQAEASQGGLQVIYEFQTAIAELMAMEASNASLYDGATALAEAIFMAVRVHRSKKTQIIIPGNIHPKYLEVIKTALKYQNIQLTSISYDKNTGKIDLNSYKQALSSNTAAVVIAQPNFFGSIEDTDQLVNLAHDNNSLVIAQVNPIAMSLIQPPGLWGNNGADISCGEGQPLGIPLSMGGPYFGFMCTKMKNIRQMPGRIVGKTKDAKGTDCYTLTLQTREQHIRRAKATSNICTNQGLMVTAATIFMNLLGTKGILDIAKQSHANAITLQQELCSIPNTRLVFDAPFFNEFVLEFNSKTNILDALQDFNIQGGFDLSNTHIDFPNNTILICATEQSISTDITRYQQAITSILQRETA